MAKRDITIFLSYMALKLTAGGDLVPHGFILNYRVVLLGSARQLSLSLGATEDERIGQLIVIVKKSMQLGKNEFVVF